MAGKTIAAGLVDAAATISPYDDVRGYLQQTLLPVLGPSIEDLLHHVHSSGELQRVLREKVESERRAQTRRNSDPDVEATEKATATRRSSRVAPSANTGDEPLKDAPPGSSGRARRPSAGGSSADAAAAAAAAAAAGAMTAPDPTADQPAFDPLGWLSETLQKSAFGDISQYKETITERVIQQIKAQEAAEEAERAKAEAEAAEARRAEEGEAAPEGGEAS